MQLFVRIIYIKVFKFFKLFLPTGLGFNDHDKFVVLKQRGEAFSEGLVGEVKAISEPPVATFVVDAEPDPDATQPLLDEIELAGPSSEPRREAGGSCLTALVGDKPYVGLQRKKRRN